MPKQMPKKMHKQLSKPQTKPLLMLPPKQQLKQLPEYKQYPQSALDTYFVFLSFFKS